MTAPRPPVTRLDPEVIAALPEPLRACPQCASLALRMADHRDGVIPGYGSLMKSACATCGYLGEGLLFRRREEYLRFVEALAREGP